MNRWRITSTGDGDPGRIAFVVRKNDPYRHYYPRNGHEGDGMAVCLYEVGTPEGESTIGLCEGTYPIAMARLEGSPADWHRVRLEADGAHLILYVDGEKTVDVWHEPFEGTGHIGFDQRGAQGAFDNVWVSEGPELPAGSGRVVSDGFEGGDASAGEGTAPEQVWYFDAPAASGGWSVEGGRLIDRASTPGKRAGMARMIHQERFTASFDLQLDPTSSGDSRYVALVFRARHAGSDEGYQLRVTDGGTLQLYAPLEGIVASAALPFDPAAAMHTYRLESDGARFRAFAEGELLFEVPDRHRQSGRYLGLLVSRSGGFFDDVRIESGTPGAARPGPAAGYAYEYHLTGHLGNTRVAFAPAEDGAARIVQQSGYYPYGMQMAGLGQSESDNDYLYNGKELEDELGLRWYHYGARYYDVQVARWTTMDPADEFHTPYSYVGGDPVNLVDPDGRQSIYFDQQGNKAGEDRGFWDFIRQEKYYVQSPQGSHVYGEKSYMRANSKETIEFMQRSPSGIDYDFVTTTMETMLQSSEGLLRGQNGSMDAIYEESIGGVLDFKLALQRANGDGMLYHADGVLYNKNEAGNFTWSYYLARWGVSGIVENTLVNGKSFLDYATPGSGRRHMLDEPWDAKARSHGREFYEETNPDL